jgi:hypothetical protein
VAGPPLHLVQDLGGFPSPREDLEQSLHVALAPVQPAGPDDLQVDAVRLEALLHRLDEVLGVAGVAAPRVGDRLEGLPHVAVRLALEALGGEGGRLPERVHAVHRQVALHLEARAAQRPRHGVRQHHVDEVAQVDLAARRHAGLDHVERLAGEALDHLLGGPVGEVLGAGWHSAHPPGPR